MVSFSSTVVGREFSKPEDITKYLGFAKKKLAVVFNHILGCEFFGSDLFTLSRVVLRLTKYFKKQRGKLDF